MIGAGTVVTRDVAAHALVVGNPARQISWACTFGATLDPALVCRGCQKAIRRSGDTIEPID